MKILGGFGGRLIFLSIGFVCLMGLDIMAAGPSSLPLISRNLPAFASVGSAPAANDNHYETTWRGRIPGWIAYDLSGVPAAQRGKIVVVWYNGETYDYDYTIKKTEVYSIPTAYTIEGNPAAGGGEAPASGWVVLAAVSGNTYHSRQHVLNFTGYNWLRMNITGGSGSGKISTASINVDVHDAGRGVEDDWIFYGDSITAGGMVVRGGEIGNFAEMIAAKKPGCFPVAEYGGIGGLLSKDGVQYINTWLSVFPGKYVAIAYGTNDAWGNQAGAYIYNKNMETIVKAVLAAGKVPVIPKIPWARLADVQQYLPAYNAKIDALYKAYPKIIKGPDLWEFFQKNQNYISEDGVHPTADGYNAMRQAWADEMLKTVYK